MGNPFVHVELMSTDIDKAKAFYGRLFDWRLEDTPEKELRRLARAAVAERRVTPEPARARAEQLASFMHFLNIPILLVIVSLGALRPSDCLQFVIGVLAASLLNYVIPRLYPWGGDETRPSRSIGE